MRGDGIRRRFRSGRIGRRPFRSLSRYDLLLLVIPLAFLLCGFGAAVTSLPPKAALVGGASVGVVAMFDGLFRRPPRRPPAEAVESGGEA